MTRTVVCIIGLICFATSACSEYVPVEGSVTLDGEPLTKASITFVPPTSTPLSVALTDDQGKFQLMTKELGDGTLPGTYKVTVSKTEPGEVKQPETIEPGQATIVHGMFPPRKPLVPRIYMNPATTPLEVTIPDDGDREIKLELKSDI